MVRSLALALAFAMLAHPAAVQAVPTPITVRVLAKDAKLVGDPAGGASVVIRDTLTGTVLATGKTKGGTGSTRKLVVDPIGRGTVWAQPGDAEFSATIDIAEPRKITVEVGSPGFGAYGGSSVSQTQWVLPGKPPYGPNGWVLELPGFIVDILKPGRHQELAKGPATVPVEANIVLMCGCPLEAGGLWDPSKYEIGYSVTLRGRPVASGTLPYAGAANRFAARFVAPTEGVYLIVVTAYDPATGNSGVAETSVQVD